MPMFGPPSLPKTIAAGVAGVLFIIGIGSALKIVGNTAKGQLAGGSGSVLQVWASSGAQVGLMNSSGSLVMSGNLIVGHARTGSGKIQVMGTDGGGICFADQDGTGCTCADYNNGAQILRLGSTADCTAETHR